MYELKPPKAVTLVKKGNIGAVYDTRIAHSQGSRKQLAVIAAKCVRSCRERRPAMKDVVGWLTGMSKLVPLHSWNGFNNPCMMVETIGHLVEYRNPNENLDGKFAASKDSRRVYSELGLRSNLMELLGITHMEEEADDDASSHKFGQQKIGKFGSRRNELFSRSSFTSS